MRVAGASGIDLQQELPLAVDSRGRRGSKNRVAMRLAGSGARAAVDSVSAARRLVLKWASEHLPNAEIKIGLPEVDDRFAAWRVALLGSNSAAVGELMVRCSDGAIVRSPDPGQVIERLGGSPSVAQRRPRRRDFAVGDVTIVCGDAESVLRSVDDEQFGLVVTSPPYFNAKPEYAEYTCYDDYLSILRRVFVECRRTLQEGRFLIVNASPVLVRRPARNRSSRRLPVPFHINAIVEEIGFDFIDDIIWMKPAGAGWNTGRGRRFAADRHPLQYKP